MEQAGPPDEGQQPSTSSGGQGSAPREPADQPVSSAAKLKKLRELQASGPKKGVLYISRIPPHLKPHKLRHLLAGYGELGRLYLAPEDKYIQARRKKLGSDSGKSFSEGWVEFLSKANAKQAAALLNGQPMGGKHRSAHRHDLWSLKYLSGFQWDQLTDEIAYQNAVRDQKLAHEISAAKRERDFYLSRVDKAKAISAQQERKRKRGTEEGADTAPAQPVQQPAAQGSVRGFQQKQARADPVADKQAPSMSTRMLKLIAGSNE